jgi:simple sugar transport system ATP-binding protein
LGLSIIFISHKLHEVMAIADRCVVLRHGKVVGQVDTHATDRAALAALMVGSAVALPKAETRAAGPVLMRLCNVTTRAKGTATGLSDLSLDLCAGQIVGLAGVSGNGQAALADLISGLLRPDQGRIEIDGAEPAAWSPRQAVNHQIARIPEDRHKTGTISDFNLTENAVLEAYSRPPFSRHGWMNWPAAQAFAKDVIAKYDVRCQGVLQRIRLLSGGNMQKLILGRVLEPGPKIILANQPVRGLDVGAIAYVQSRLIAARDAGAAVLLISEDLDEIQSLSDVIHVISEGRLSPGFARGSKTAAELGLWMAGQGFRVGDHAA